MSKVQGSYDSVVRGVSEQVPQDRRSGQHFEQVNMISDPVRGLARRHGSVMQDEAVIGSYDEATYTAMLADTLRHRVVTFFISGVEYDLIIRSTPAVAGAGAQSFAWAFRKDTAKFVPVVLANDPLMLALQAGGCSAATNVGAYVYLAGNTVVPTWTPTNTWNVASNRRHAVAWVRSGAFSRTFTVTATMLDGTQIVGSYKTVSASYPTLLDTSDISVDSKDPATGTSNYQKLVNDRVNAYNAQVTKWIGTSAADITPENIAQKIVDSLTANGLSGVTRIDGNVVIDNVNLSEISASDGGDDTLLRAVGSEVTAPDLVSYEHFAGKVVRVRPKTSKGDDAFYLQAYPKDVGATGVVPVIWREAAGYKQQPLSVFAMGTIVNGTLYIAGSATSLGSLTGQVHPEFKPNAVGDDLSCPLPYFFGKTIHYLGVFQDRLVIGAGATLLFSRPGDYFNFYRQSVLTVIDSDPWEGYALGAEDDTIRHSTTYDRDLYLHGDRFQYTINGRQVLSPKTASIVKATAYQNAADAAPQSLGNYVFYAKYAGRAGAEFTSVHQVQSGQVADAPESYCISQQLDRYLDGKPVQIIPIHKPDTLFLRTTGARNRVYTYTYLDSGNGGQRLFDAWNHWEWDTGLGDLVGVSPHLSTVYMYMLRHGLDASGSHKTWVAAELFYLDTDLSDLPYLDSLRPTASVLAGGSSYINVNTLAAVPSCLAFVRSSSLAFLGAGLDKLISFVGSYGPRLGETYAGIQFPAYVTPTNPYRLDRNGKSITSGRLTLGRISVSVADTGGMVGTVTSRLGTREALHFTGRVLAQPADIIGQQPIVTRSVSMAIGHEVKECSYTLAALNWLPLTITAIEYTGQAFLNSRRI